MVEVGALVKALHEAMASGKGVFGKALGVDGESGDGDIYGDGDGDGEGGQAEEEGEEAN